MKWAVLGASGFVGSRFVEKIHLTGEASVLPIVRNFSSLARLARFELDWRVTGLTDVPKLTEALRGCDVLLHSIVGDEPVIIGSIEPVYKAAQAAGIRRIVYLSSSSVHGLAPEPSTTEDSPLSDQQPFVYNNAKVRAEKVWERVRATGAVEVVGLRPSIVFGPRSRWCADLAKDILNSSAYLLRRGSGICNTIYIDNLIEAILLAAQTPNINGQFFLVRDEQSITWRDFYEPVLDACQLSIEDVHQAEAPLFRKSWKDRLSVAKNSSLANTVKTLVPRTAIRIGKAAFEAFPTPPEPSPFHNINKPIFTISPEIAALQQCEWQMPYLKAQRYLGYKPTTSFAEGMRRSIAWLKFAGYPVRTSL